MNGLGVTILVASFCVLIAGLFAVIVERTNERDEARAERDHLDAEADALAATIHTAAEDIADLTAECELLHLALTEAQIAAGVVVPLPGLRVVPPAADEDDYWLNLMRQTEGER